MKRSSLPQHIGDILGQWVKNEGLAGPLARGMVLEKWQSLLSDQMTAQIEKSWIKGDKLYVTVRSAAWRLELHAQREAWRKRLNDEVGSEAIREILFR